MKIGACRYNVEILKTISQISGLLAIIGLFITVAIFFITQRNFLKVWKEDYDEFKVTHMEDTTTQLEKISDVSNKIDIQGIHAGYLKEAVKESQIVIKKMNEAIAQLTIVLEDLARKAS